MRVMEGSLDLILGGVGVIGARSAVTLDIWPPRGKQTVRRKREHVREAAAEPGVNRVALVKVARSK